jgi:polyphosphate glucokinase
MPSTRKKTNGAPKKRAAEPPSKILTVDIGGTKLKILASGETEPRKAASGKRLSPARMVEVVRSLASDWKYEAVSIGYPGLVGNNGPRSEPGNLGPGWVGFDYALAFDMPVRIVNDAAMQALGSYEGGRMLFLGFGTGLGSALIAEHVIVPLELGRMAYKDGRTLGEVLGRDGLKSLGKGAWRDAVREVASTLMAAFVADHVVIGGGNAKLLKDLPPGMRRGHNLTAFRGGFRLWDAGLISTLPADGTPPWSAQMPVDWRLI